MNAPWPVAAALSAELVPAETGDRIAKAWADLAERALEPNAFYAPAFGRAGLAHLPERHGARLLLAWRGEGDTRRLVGLLPVVRPRGRALNPWPVGRAAAFYGTLSTPLVDPDRPAETLAAMLDAAARAGLSCLLLPFLHEEGPVRAALAEVERASGRPAVRLDGHRRAMLRSPLGGRGYARSVLDTKRRKEVDRQRRRLAEEGEVGFALARDAAAIGPALEEFLALEAAGWKGTSGTALALAPGGAGFIRDVAAVGAQAGRFAVASLRLDGRAIAAGLVALSGRRAFYCKTAYDESVARFSPGVLLTLDLTARLLDDPGIDDADSIAVAGHPMIDRIWTERFPVCALALATRRGGGLGFRGAVAFERLREATRAEIKARWIRWRASRKPDGHDTARKIPPAAAI